MDISRRKQEGSGGVQFHRPLRKYKRKSRLRKKVRLTLHQGGKADISIDKTEEESLLMEELHCRGERALLLAILERAIVDACNDRKDIREHQKRAAFRWIKYWKEGDSEIPFTFPWICNFLGTDPERVRDLFLSYIEEGSSPRLLASAPQVIELFDMDDGAEYAVGDIY